MLTSLRHGRPVTPTTPAPFVTYELDISLGDDTDFGPPKEWSTWPYRHQSTETERTPQFDDAATYTTQLSLAPSGNVSVMVRFESFVVVVGITPEGQHWCDLVHDHDIDWKQDIFSLHHEYMRGFDETGRCLPMWRRDGFLELVEPYYVEPMVGEEKYTCTVDLYKETGNGPGIDGEDVQIKDRIDAYFTLPDNSEYSFIADYEGDTTEERPSIGSRRNSMTTAMDKEMGMIYRKKESNDL